MLTIGSLFSGIGGLELGLERAGLGPVLWQVEQDPYCRSVLSEHWPDSERFEDVREVGDELKPVDLICGGFPCQDISQAGSKLGIEGPQSGLWREFARVLRLVRPRFVVVENSAALLTRGFDTVLGDLAALGYDAEWGVLSACAVGAPHTRERLFVVAYANASDGQARVGTRPLRQRAIPQRCDRSSAWSDSVSRSLEASRSDGREADGSARRMVAALGNAVVPQVAEVIGGVVHKLHESTGGK